jgi:hypothetical protein
MPACVYQQPFSSLKVMQLADGWILIEEGPPFWLIFLLRDFVRSAVWEGEILVAIVLEYSQSCI